MIKPPADFRFLILDFGLLLSRWRLCLAVVVCLLTGHVRASESSTALASDLFAEGDWQACRVECMRLVTAFPACWDAHLMQAIAEQHTGLDRRDALLALADNPAVPASCALRARYEWARVMWRAGEWQEAFAGFRLVFNQTASENLMIRSGCSLGILLRRYPALARYYPELLPQVRTLRRFYTAAILDECELRELTPSLARTGLPGQWLVKFYRRQIRPAVGERCALSPSCSEYARQAFQKHGILGLAMMADRFFREPGVVAAAEKPVDVNGKRYYADPLSDHDEWLGK